MRVIFHGKCMDGSAAAWVAGQFFQTSKFLFGKRFNPIDGGEDPVVFVDFVYGEEIMRTMPEKSIIWDHHDSSSFLLSEDFDDFEVVLDYEKCAASIAFSQAEEKLQEILTDENFEHLRKIIEIIEDRDLFLKKLPETNAVIEAMYALGLDDPKKFDQIFDLSIERLELMGDAILLDKKRRMEKTIRDATDGNILIGGKEVTATLITSHGVEVTDLSYQLHKVKKCEVVAVAKFSKKHESWQVSLRAFSDDVDLTDLTKVYGGGGHKKAASMLCKNLDFFNASDRIGKFFRGTKKRSSGTRSASPALGEQK
jgi:nanoRNase/pAp phosphatase (c-di-AMP/oligoRNAs hydrolase)